MHSYACEQREGGREGEKGGGGRSREGEREGGTEGRCDLVGRRGGGDGTRAGKELTVDIATATAPLCFER